jgi:hypothetical protein
LLKGKRLKSIMPLDLYGSLDGVNISFVRRKRAGAT